MLGDVEAWSKVLNSVESITTVVFICQRVFSFCIPIVPQALFCKQWILIKNYTQPH